MKNCLNLEENQKSIRNNVDYLIKQIPHILGTYFPIHLEKFINSFNRITTGKIKEDRSAKTF